MTAQSTAIRLPSPARLEQICLALAALDCVLISDPYDRMFSFNPNWRGDARLATMTNGAGGEYRIIFESFGTFVGAFDHESPLSPWNNPDKDLASGMLEGFPREMSALATDPAFSVEGSPAAELTFCAWTRTDGEAGWWAGQVEDDGGASWLLEVVLGDSPELYKSYLEEFLGRELVAEQLETFFGLEPVTGLQLETLGVESSSEEMLSNLASIGYPVER